MSAVIVTGISGAGKSTVASELVRRGLPVLESDDDPRLARFVDREGAVVEEPGAPDLAWLAEHFWNWDPARLDELIRAAPPSTLYVCGGADNQLELADRFTHVILLEIDEPTMLARLDDPERYNDWGRVGDTREFCAAGFAGIRTSCVPSAPSPSTPPSRLTRSWTRSSSAPEYGQPHLRGLRRLSPDCGLKLI